MFIPINAKADISGSKKGKVNPSQNAQLNAFCLGNKTGILNCLGKCTAQNSYYSAVNNEANIVFNSGYVVICGRLVECEAGSVFTATTPSSGTETGWIIMKYDLSASEENEFKIVQKKTTDGALVQQDLNENPITGIYEFPLYSYTATPTGITLTREVGYIDSVEDRLERLGFKEGSLDVSGGTITANSFTRQGNYVIGNVDCTGISKNATVERIVIEGTAYWSITAYIDINNSIYFIPETQDISFYSKIIYRTYHAIREEWINRERIEKIYVTSNTKLFITFLYGGSVDNAQITGLEFNCGYEAEPLD